MSKADKWGLPTAIERLSDDGRSMTISPCCGGSVMDLAQKMGWPSGVCYGDGVGPGGSQSAWHEWCLIMVAGNPLSHDKAWCVLHLLHNITRAIREGVDVGPSSTWAEVDARREHEAHEGRKQRLIEIYAENNQQRAELLATVARLDWPRIHSKYLSGRSEWVKGAMEWRTLLRS